MASVAVERVMKRAFCIVLVVAAATAFAQEGDLNRSTGAVTDSAAMRLVNKAVASAADSVRAGKKVAITVDNRLVSFSPRLVKGRLLVPARLFEEAGQKVMWENHDKRGYIRDDRDPRRSVDLDAREPRDQRDVAALRPYLENGRLWVPLAQVVGSLGHTLDWVPSSNRLNLRTNRALGR